MCVPGELRHDVHEMPTEGSGLKGDYGLWTVTISAKSFAAGGHGPADSLGENGTHIKVHGRDNTDRGAASPQALRPGLSLKILVRLHRHYWTGR